LTITRTQLVEDPNEEPRNHVITPPSPHRLPLPSLRDVGIVSSPLSSTPDPHHHVIDPTKAKADNTRSTDEEEHEEEEKGVPG